MIKYEEELHDNTFLFNTEVEKNLVVLVFDCLFRTLKAKPGYSNNFYQKGLQVIFQNFRVVIQFLPRCL